MLKNQKRLEEDQAVTVKIIQSKDQEIKKLKALFKSGKRIPEDQDIFEICDRSQVQSAIENLGLLLTSPRQAITSNIAMLKVYLGGENEDECEENISWGGIVISASAKIVGGFLAKIF